MTPLPSSIFAPRPSLLSMVARRLRRVHLMDRNIIRSIRGNYVEYVKCAKLELQRAGFDCLHHDLSVWFGCGKMLSGYEVCSVCKISTL